MNLFDWHPDHSRNVLDQAPRWAKQQGEMLAIVMLQNEAILAKLEQRESKLSPEDQAKLNQIFDRATEDTAKIDEALPK